MWLFKGNSGGGTAVVFVDEDALGIDCIFAEIGTYRPPFTILTFDTRLSISGGGGKRNVPHAMQIQSDQEFKEDCTRVVVRVIAASSSFVAMQFNLSLFATLFLLGLLLFFFLPAS